MYQTSVSVVVPAYNEQGAIGATLSEITSVMNDLRVPYEVIVVDDGSIDQTGQIASTHKVTLLSNERNRGKGYSLRRGFAQCQGDIVITIDSDGAHSPKEIPDLIYPLYNGADIVSGSRFLGEGKNFTSKLNRIGNILFNLTIMIVTGKRITDSQTGFRAYKKQVLQELNLRSIGYEIDAELIVKGLRNGFAIHEKSIFCQRRVGGTSKLRILSDGVKIFRAILKASI